MNAMTRGAGLIPWALVLVVFLLGGGEGRAKEGSFALERVDIQSLRYLQQQRDPPILASLSKTGWQTLFGDRGLGVTTVVINSDGLWQWRGPHDGDLSAGEQGKATDAPLVRKLLTGTSGKVTDTIEVPETVASGMRLYKRVADIRIVKQGGPTQIVVDHYRQLVLTGKNLWESSHTPKETKERDARMIGDLLRQLPDDKLKKVFSDFEPRLLAEDWIDLSKQYEKKSIDLFPNAKRADTQSLTPINLTSVFDEEKNEFVFPTPVSRIDLLGNVYTIPAEPGKNVWIKVKAGNGLKETELQTANATKLLGWMKDDTVEMFLQTKDAPMKVMPDQWERHINTMQNRLAPRK
jgi:hypothetical protein